MKSIKISGSKKISAIQKEFNDEFPFLKIEFFNHAHKTHRGSPKKDIINSGLTLKQSGKKASNGEIVLKENMKVSELEELFQSLFGLSVQIFRKSGRSWIETTVTDDWTLARQNEEGKELSSLAK